MDERIIILTAYVLAVLSKEFYQSPADLVGEISDKFDFEPKLSEVTEVLKVLGQTATVYKAFGEKSYRRNI